MKTRRFHYAWVIFVVAFITLVGAAGFRSTPGVLIDPLRNEFGWNRSTVGFAVSINVLLFGLMGPFAAALQLRFGLRRVTMTALATISLGALATTRMNAPWHLYLLWGVVVGIGSGCMATVFASTVASRWFVARRGLITGALTAASASGQLIFLPLLTRLADNHGWRTVGVVIAVCSAAVIPIVFVFLRNSPADIGQLPYGASDDYVAVAPLEHPIRAAFETLNDACRDQIFWLLWGSFMVCGLSTNGLVQTHFISAAHDHHIDETTAASLLALIGVLDVAVFVRQSVSMQRNPGVVPPAPRLPVFTAIVTAAAVFCLVVIGVRYQSLPGGRIESSATKTHYVWGPFKFPSSRAFSDGWARWNFSGYEGKGAYKEYHDIVQAMKALGEDPAHGCGRALWENNGELNKYGTTMGLMLLPFWTKGCIGSMEGLYFEAAGTTPYHFVAAAALSKQSSNPVRELRYDNNNPRLGVKYMRSLGIRYYMAFTPEAVSKAATEPELREVTTTGPWHVYEIADTSLVEPLNVRPVVVNRRSGDQRERWLEVGMSWFQHGDEWPALPVADGPADWQHVDAVVDESRQVGKPGEPGRQVDIVKPGQDVATEQLPAVKISNVVVKEESISFDVDRTNVPVLVKVSYFPNWRSRGASAPLRASLLAAPARGVPVAPVVRCVHGHDDLVADTRGDLLVAARTAVGLHVLVRLHVAHLDRVGITQGRSPRRAGRG